MSWEWFSISATKPDDHECCLVAEGDRIGIAYWHENCQSFAHEDIDNYWEPTHWMPLPAPPTDAK